MPPKLLLHLTHHSSSRQGGENCQFAFGRKFLHVKRQTRGFGALPAILFALKFLMVVQHVGGGLTPARSIFLELSLKPFLIPGTTAGRISSQTSLCRLILM